MDTRGNLYRGITEAETAELEKMRTEINDKHSNAWFMLSDGEYRELKPLTVIDRKNKFRNKPCPCGSGKKFKKCCFNK